MSLINIWVEIVLTYPLFSQLVIPEWGEMGQSWAGSCFCLHSPFSHLCTPLPGTSAASWAVSQRGCFRKTWGSLLTFRFWPSCNSRSQISISCDLLLFIYFLFVPPPYIFISWRLITLQYCSDFCRTLTWISHGFTCVPHPDPLSHLPPHPIPLGLPSAPALNTCWDLLLKWRWDPILQVSEQICDSTDPACLRVCWVASVMASSLRPHEL